MSGMVTRKQTAPEPSRWMSSAGRDVSSTMRVGLVPRRRRIRSLIGASGPASVTGPKYRIADTDVPARGARLLTRLFDRNRRNVALTPTGRQLLPLLRTSLQDMESVLRDARALGEGDSGTIRIACLPTFAASVLPELIIGMKREVPRVVFQIRDVVASTVNSLVRNEEADIGLTGGEVLDPMLEVLCTAVDRLVAVCPRRHPLAKMRRVGLS